MLGPTSESIQLRRPGLPECLRLRSNRRPDVWAPSVSQYIITIAFQRSWGLSSYVDARAAIQQNLTYASEDRFITRADFTKFLPPNGPGRDSVRLKSFKQYTTSVMMYAWLFGLETFQLTKYKKGFNVFHMPTGCGYVYRGFQNATLFHI